MLGPSRAMTQAAVVDHDRSCTSLKLVLGSDQLMILRSDIDGGTEFSGGAVGEVVS